MIANRLLRTRPRLAPLSATTILFLTPGLSAQDAPPLGTPAAPERECVCAWQGEAPRMLRSMARMNRARIGAELGPATEVDGRTGIRLQDVEEGGPAARAGIRAGDILLSVDGTALGDRPADRLLALLAEAEPGDTLTVDYSRDGREQTARVVTDRAPRVFFRAAAEAPEGWSIPRMERLREAVRAPDAPPRLRRFSAGGIELVAMNEGLGRYFDVSEGVLVTSVAERSALGLRPGDVILTIGGRAVQDPAHARSIIASYRPDETIAFEVVRERRRTTVSGTRDRG